MTINTKTAEENNKIRKLSGKATTINPYEISEYVLAFFLNKICLFGALSPFGISYFAATFPMHDMSLGAVTAFLGIIFAGFGITSLKYIGALSLYLIFMIIYNKDLTDKKWISALAGSVSLFVVGTVFVIMDGFLLYDMMLLSLETIICFVSFFAYNRASVLLRTFKSRKVFEPTDILSMVFLFSGIILAVASIPGCEPLSQVLSVSAILLIAYTQGFHLSCATGVVLGIVMSINSPLPSQVICTYTISSLCAGLMRHHGKLGVSFGFLAANALMMIYLNSSSVTIINVICTLTGALIILMLPKAFIKKISEFVNTPLVRSSVVSDTHKSEIIAQKLSTASDSFSELSDIFSTMAKKTSETNELSAGAVFDTAIDSVCRNCNLCTYCWHKNYDETLNAISEMFSSMSERGYAIEFDASADFRSKCIHFDDFLETVNKNYEIQKINISWASKVLESRNLVAEQFKNVSSVLDNLKKQVSRGIVCDEDLELKVKAELDKKGISTAYIRVIYTDCYEVMLSVPSCGKKRICRDLIATATSTAIGVPLYVEKRSCGETQCNLKLIEKSNYSVEIGFAKTSDTSTGASGDSHLFCILPDGKYLLCLSDGMGRGKDASIQSKITVNLIKKLLSIGFDKETALKIINTFLLFKSQKETFATADICVFNLHSGALEFLKSGAVNSYIKSRFDTTKIKCTSLPAGAISNLSVDCELLYAKDGDYIIMVTDGITDLLETKEKNMLKTIIESFCGNSPQELADEIIKAAIKEKADNSFDDMTVLVARITEEM